MKSAIMLMLGSLLTFRAFADIEKVALDRLEIDVLTKAFSGQLQLCRVYNEGAGLVARCLIRDPNGTDFIADFDNMRLGIINAIPAKPRSAGKPEIRV